MRCPASSRRFSLSQGVLGLVALALVACDAKPDEGSKPAATAATSAAPAPKEPVAEAPALDVKSLRDALGCGGKKRQACGILDDFTECVPFKPNPSAAEARWLGEGFEVSGGSVTEEFTLFYAERVPVDEVAPGQFPAKVAIAKLPAGEKGPQLHAPKAVGAFKRGDVALVENMAIKYLKARTDWSTGFISHAADNQAFMNDGGGVHVCALADQRLLLVKKSAAGADGLYATLWPVSW